MTSIHIQDEYHSQFALKSRGSQEALHVEIFQINFMSFFNVAADIFFWQKKKVKKIYKTKKKITMRTNKQISDAFQSLVWNSARHYREQWCTAIITIAVSNVNWRILWARAPPSKKKKYFVLMSLISFVVFRLFEGFLPAVALVSFKWSSRLRRNMYHRLISSQCLWPWLYES